MSEHALRLIWALPLVLGLGLGLLLLIKRWGGDALFRPVGVNPTMRSVTELSPHTKAVVLEVGNQAFLIVESTAHLQVQPLGGGAVAPQSAFSTLLRHRAGSK